MSDLHASLFTRMIWFFLILCAVNVFAPLFLLPIFYLCTYFKKKSLFDFNFLFATWHLCLVLSVAVDNIDLLISVQCENTYLLLYMYFFFCYTLSVTWLAAPKPDDTVCLWAFGELHPQSCLRMLTRPADPDSDWRGALSCSGYWKPREAYLIELTHLTPLAPGV